MKKEKTYELTLKGLLNFTINDEEVLKNTLDSVELYLRRNFAKGGDPAIVLDLEDSQFHFVTLHKK